MKYIIFESPQGLETPILFPDYINHSHVASLVRVAQQKPVRAGFVTVSNPNNIDTFGESVSLRIKSGEHDASMIRRAFHAD